MRAFLLAAAMAALCVTPAFAGEGDGDTDDNCPALSTVSQANDGQCVSVAVGGTLSLALRTNGGIPYRWVVTSDGSPNLSVDQGSQQAATPGLLGGAATMTYTFTAEQAGSAVITAELQSVTSGAANQSVSITVHVTE
ncbi:MAG: protease inhibitor I42 family protein [Alphaproteobacteria bacterium]|nr:protease inhibitor I42 family protein [Alphaproteobacteria bacterium]MBL7099492.1 protease inhibitor I42 family protein [Alphaproteobacteria bacterium]